MTMVVMEMSMLPPCHGRPGFLQPGEFKDWHQHWPTRAAVTICETRCPTAQLVNCARGALIAGVVDDQPSVVRPADGVVAAGIVCRGDAATTDALNEVIARHTGQRRPARCTGCRRVLVPKRHPLEGDSAHHAAQGLCTGCYTATYRARHSATVHELNPPKQCEDCQRPMVPRSSRPPAGHVRYAAKGVCTTCSSKRRYRTRTA